MTDQFETYRDLLAGKNVAIDVNNPIPGYYRVRSARNGPWRPVAIWRTEDNRLVCRVAGEMKDPVQVWQWCAKNPMPKEEVAHAFKNGTWPGDLENAGIPERIDGPAEIGDNSGDITAKQELLDIIEQAEAWALQNKRDDEIDKTTADRAANLDDKVMKLEKAAIAERAGEIEPIEEEIRKLKEAQERLRKVKAEWKDLFEKVPTARGMLKAVYQAWQRTRSLAGEDTKCGGQYANRKSYQPKQDPLHPDTIAAAKAAEAAQKAREEEEARIKAQLAEEAEAKRRADVLAEAERLQAERAAEKEKTPEPPQEPEKAPPAAGVKIETFAPSFSITPAKPKEEPPAAEVERKFDTRVPAFKVTNQDSLYTRYKKDERVAALLRNLATDEIAETGEIFDGIEVV